MARLVLHTSRRAERGLGPHEGLAKRPAGEARHRGTRGCPSTAAARGERGRREGVQSVQSSESSLER